MTRNEFLGELRSGLSGLRPQDLTDIIADYDAETALEHIPPASNRGGFPKVGG